MDNMQDKQQTIDRRKWTVVCKHWLKGLCQKDDKCEYLHQYDLSRMPICSSITKGRPCTSEDCVFKHIDPNQKRCPRYELGFCIKGPQCKERHERTNDPPSYLPDKYFAEIINPMFHSMVPMKTDSLFLPAGQVQFQGTSRYFIACGTTEAIQTALINSAWATTNSNLTVLRNSLKQSENVALIFRDDKYFYGFAKIVGDIDPNFKPGIFGDDPSIASNFRIRWIKKCRLDLDTTNQLRNPFDGMLRVRMGKEAQEIEGEVAEKICSMMVPLQDYEVLEYKKSKRQREDEKNGKHPDKKHRSS